MSCKIGQSREQMAQDFLSHNSIVDAWAIYASANKTCWQEMKVADIVGVLVRTGSISDKQIALLKDMLAERSTWADKNAKRAVDKANALPCPDGPVKVQGIVLSVKNTTDRWGDPVCNMLVKSDEGWQIYGPVPCYVKTILKGMRVRFATTVKTDYKDDKFGFFQYAKDFHAHFLTH